MGKKRNNEAQKQGQKGTSTALLTEVTSFDLSWRHWFREEETEGRGEQ